MTQTIDELNKQVQEAQRKLVEAQQEQRRAALAAKEEAERIKREEANKVTRAANLIHAQRIVDELKKVGYPDATCGWAKDSDSVYPLIGAHGKLDKWDATGLRLESANAGYYRNNPVLRAAVGRYGETVYYPMRKDCTLNYAAIAAKYAEKANINHERTVARVQKANRVERNIAIAQRIRERFGLREYGDTVRPAEYTEDAVKLTITATLSEADAIALLDAIKATGLVKVS